MVCSDRLRGLFDYIPSTGMLFGKFAYVPAQAREHERLRDQGVVVFVIDDVDAGRAMVDRMRLT